MHENQIIVEGEVGSEVFKKAVKETTVCSFDVIHRCLRGGDVVDERFPVELWGAIAETFSAAVGDPILIFGRLHESSWTSKDGRTLSRVKIRAHRIKDLLKRKRSPYYT